MRSQLLQDLHSFRQPSPVPTNSNEETSSAETRMRKMKKQESRTCVPLLEEFISSVFECTLCRISEKGWALEINVSMLMFKQRIAHTQPV